MCERERERVDKKEELLVVVVVVRFWELSSEPPVPCRLPPLPHLSPHSSVLPLRSLIRRQRSAPKRLPGGLLWQQVARETAGMSCARED